MSRNKKICMQYANEREDIPCVNRDIKNFNNPRFHTKDLYSNINEKSFQ